VHRGGEHHGKKLTFSLVFAPAVKQHLKAIEAKWDTLIKTKIEEQLSHEPDVETRIGSRCGGGLRHLARIGKFGLGRTIGFEFFTKSRKNVAKCTFWPLE
jgi:hypothetical protein